MNSAAIHKDPPGSGQRPAPRMSIIASLLRVANRKALRGSTRASFTLPRWLPSLRAVPIVINGQTLFVDLRNGLTHPLLAGSPWPSAPWEADEQALMRALVRPGEVVLDIGANIGLHTVMLAGIVGPAGHVHAFEPNEELLHALRRTAEHAGNVTVHPIGLSEREETREFYIPDGDRSMASLADWTGGRVGAVQVRRCTFSVLDHLVSQGTIRHPQFIKCDIEGAETLAFRGAGVMLNRTDAPIVLYEANAQSSSAFGFTIETATGELRRSAKAEFTIFEVQPNGSVAPLPVFRSDCNQYNLLAVPRARLSEITPLLSGA